MTQLLIQGEVILAAGVMLETADYIRTYTADGKADTEYPKHVVDGWQIVDVDVPDGFTPAGYTWDGAGVVAKPAVVVPLNVPQTVTMRQARLALLGVGKLASVTDAIASLPSPQKEAVQIEWEYSQSVERNRPFVAMLAPALQLTDAQIDELFIVAATL
jgi:hypothetical protein